MTPNDYKNVKNVFLIHPPGAGGNHLANMLSLHEDFEPRFDSNEYESEMISKYESVLDLRHGDFPVHFSDLENLQDSQLKLHFNKIINSEKRYIFCAHDYEYRYADHGFPEFNTIRNRLCIVFKPPVTNKLSVERVYNGYWSSLNSLNLQNYNVDYIMNIPRVKTDYVMAFDTDKFFSHEGFDYAQATLFEHLGIQLPEIGRKLHSLYINHKVHFYNT